MEGVQTPEGTASGRQMFDLLNAQRLRPRVSVVIPTFNNAASLQRLVRALQASTIPAGGMEVIVVDDGSTDNTAKIANDAGVTHVWQTNAGTAAARDRGWRSAQGDRIVFFDDDVIPEPDVVSLLDAALDSADGVGAHFVAFGGESAVAQYTHADGLIDHRVVHGEVRWLITGAAAFRRSALERVGGFDLGFLAAGEDVDLSLRMMAAGCKLAVEPRAIVRHFHRARLSQLLETSYRYGTFSRSLASRHAAYRGERFASALRRINPFELARLYLGFRQGANRRRSLMFLILHQLVVVPYAFGLVKSKFSASPLSAPSWRQLPGASQRAARDMVATNVPEVDVRGVRHRTVETSAEPEASAV